MQERRPIVDQLLYILWNISWLLPGGEGDDTSSRVKNRWKWKICPPRDGVDQVRLHSLEHAGMFISGPDGTEMTRLVKVRLR